MSAVDVAQALYLLLSAVGLALAVSYAGLPVLGQGAFMAIGGFGTLLLGPGGEGWPLGIAALAAVLLAAATGYVVALGSSRLAGASLALATWALAWLVDRVLVAYPGVSGGPDGLTRPSPAHLVAPAFGIDLVLTPGVHVALAGGLCVLALGALARLGRGPGGLDLAALREDPELAVSLGVPVASRRRAVLTACAVLGALAGAGNAVLLGLVTPIDVSPLVSLELFVAVLLGGTARWWGPAVGVAVLELLPHPIGLLTSVLLLVVLALRGPLARRRSSAGSPPGPREPLPPAPRAQPGEVALRATGVTVGYGGVQVLRDAQIELRAGEVHALVGPNGSGKSTLLKVLAGEVPAGTVTVHGRVVPASLLERVEAGVVRTPQQTVLMPGLAADRQVAVGARGAAPRFAVLRHLLATPSTREDPIGARVREVLRSLGLDHLAGAGAQRLTAGDQRLLQVARAAATGADVLLLDEPAAGMSADERAVLATVLRVLAAQGKAVLVVEHDLELVERVADRVTDQGLVPA